MPFLVSKTFKEDTIKMMSDLGIADWWFSDEDTSFTVSKSVKHYIPPEGRELTSPELSLVEIMELTPTPIGPVKS